MKGNPTHRYMVVAVDKTSVEVCGISDNRVYRLANFNYFQIVCEIPEMLEKIPYKNPDESGY